MDTKVLDSIVEITNQRNSDTLGISILATIAELIPGCFVCLYKESEGLSSDPFLLMNSVQAKKDSNGINQYAWDMPVPHCDALYFKQNSHEFEQVHVYETSIQRHHIFIPIFNEGKVAYGLDISAKRSLDKYTEILVAIGKVCENFYAILSASEKDTLTGLLNRRTYEQKLATLLSRQQYKIQLNRLETSNQRKSNQKNYTWLAIFDVDFFKRVNDLYGHIYGDEVLLVLSQLMKASFRANDLMFRFGGEEFVIIFEPITKKQVQTILLKFMKKVEQHRFPMVGNITVSCGFAKITLEEHPKTVLDNADKALYYAKEHGRNCLYNFEDLIEQGEINLPNADGDIELF